MSPELFVLIVAVSVLTVGYVIVYPRFAGTDLTKLATNGLLAYGSAFLVVGSHFYGTDQRFGEPVLELGWFGFTLLTLLLVELPLFYWYARRYRVFTQD
jgi:hypothetical protein